MAEKKYSFIVKDTSEFGSDFEPVKNLSAEEAVKLFQNLNKSDVSKDRFGIALSIPGDKVFDEWTEEGICIAVLNGEQKVDFGIFGDTFITQLNEKNERSRTYIDAYKDLYTAFENSRKENSESYDVVHPDFLFAKENELFVQMEIENNKRTFTVVDSVLSAVDRAEFLANLVHYVNGDKKEKDEYKINDTLNKENLKPFRFIYEGYGYLGESIYESFVCKKNDDSGFKYLMVPHNAEYYKGFDKLIVSEKTYLNIEECQNALINILINQKENHNYKIEIKTNQFYSIPEKYKQPLLSFIEKNEKEICDKTEEFFKTHPEIEKHENIKNNISLYLTRVPDAVDWNSSEWLQKFEKLELSISNPLLENTIEVNKEKDNKLMDNKLSEKTEEQAAEEEFLRREEPYKVVDAYSISTKSIYDNVIKKLDSEGYVCRTQLKLSEYRTPSFSELDEYIKENSKKYQPVIVLFDEYNDYDKTTNEFKSIKAWQIYDKESLENGTYISLGKCKINYLNENLELEYKGPFVAPGSQITARSYYNSKGTRELCHVIKEAGRNSEEYKNAIEKAASYIAEHIHKSRHTYLVPAPNHNGKAEYTYDIARIVGLKINAPVFNILECKPHETLYEQKKKNLEPEVELFLNDYGKSVISNFPEGRNYIYLIDNCISTGLTFNKAAELINGLIPAVYAIGNFAEVKYVNEKYKVNNLLELKNEITHEENKLMDNKLSEKTEEQAAENKIKNIEIKPVTLDEILSVMEFTPEFTENGKIKVYDQQRSEYLDNCSDLPSFDEDNWTFSSAAEVFERMEIYINDYYIHDMQEQLEGAGVEITGEETLADLCKLYQAELEKGNDKLSIGELNLAMGIVHPETVILREEVIKQEQSNNKSSQEIEIHPEFLLYGNTPDEKIVELKEHLSMNGYDIKWKDKTEDNNFTEFTCSIDDKSYIQTILEDRGIDYEYDIGLLSTGYDASWLSEDEILDAEIVTEEEFKRINELREKEFKDLKLPYIKIDFTEVSTSKHKPARMESGTVLGLKEGEELLKELNNRFNTFLKCDVTVHFPDAKDNEPGSYSLRYDFCDDKRTLENGKEVPFEREGLSDYIRMTCSYPEVLEKYEQQWQKVNAPDITDEQKEFVSDIISSVSGKLEESYKKHLESLKALVENDKKHSNQWIISADVAKESKEALDKRQNEIAFSFNHFTGLCINYIADYLEENKGMAFKDEFINYAHHQISNMLQDVKYGESRNAKYGEHGYDFDFSLWRKSLEKVMDSSDFKTFFIDRLQEEQKRSSEVRAAAKDMGLAKEETYSLSKEEWRACDELAKKAKMDWWFEEYGLDGDIHKNVTKQDLEDLSTCFDGYLTLDEKYQQPIMELFKRANIEYNDITLLTTLNEHTGAAETQSVNLFDLPAEELRESLKYALNESAETLPEIDFTRENYNKLFPYSKINTPIETVKIGAHQFEKLEAKDRKNLLQAVHDVLSEPDLIINEEKESVFGDTEFSHVYAKSYVINEKTKAVQSVVVNIEDEYISISTHKRDISNVVNKIKKPDQLLFAAAKVRLLAERLANEKSVTVSPNRENEYVIPPQTNIPQSQEKSSDEIMQNSFSIKGEKYSFSDAERLLKEDIASIFEELDSGETEENLTLNDVKVYGNPEKDGKIKLLVEFDSKNPENKWSEDSVFNAIADENITFNGMEVDVNPITPKKSGTIEEYLSRLERLGAVSEAEAIEKQAELIDSGEEVKNENPDLLSWQEIEDYFSARSVSETKNEVLESFTESQEKPAEKELKEECVARLLENQIDFYGFDTNKTDDKLNSEISVAKWDVLEKIAEKTVSKELDLKPYAVIQEEADKLLMENSVFQECIKNGIISEPDFLLKTENKKDIELTAEDIKNAKALLPKEQYQLVLGYTQGEEGEHFKGIIKEISSKAEAIKGKKEILTEDEKHPLAFKYIMGASSFYFSEWDGGDELYGYVVLNGNTQDSEWGYTSLEKLKNSGSKDRNGFPVIPEMIFYGLEDTIEKQISVDYPELTEQIGIKPKLNHNEELISEFGKEIFETLQSRKLEQSAYNICCAAQFVIRTMDSSEQKEIFSIMKKCGCEGKNGKANTEDFLTEVVRAENNTASSAYDRKRLYEKINKACPPKKAEAGKGIHNQENDYEMEI